MAQRIQNKRSSLLGKRPDGSYLEPGEIALNTNSADPGLFFELTDGSVAKVGPTSIGPNPPSSEVGYGIGELWYDTGNNVLKTWDPEAKTWKESTTNGGNVFALFVNSQSEDASDSLANDGVARPFATLNRACIEVVRRTIFRGRLDEPFNDKFAIILQSGDNMALNEPGLSLEEFEAEVGQFSQDQELTFNQLRYFNDATGGVILPRGATIYGFDLRKAAIRPSFYPKWTRDLYTAGTLEERSSVVKWTGNCHITNVTFKDKVSSVSVTRITGEADDTAVLTSLEPHGFRSAVISQSEITTADEVNLTYPGSVSRTYNGEPTIAEGAYFADPIDARRFRLRKADGSLLLRRDLPLAPGSRTKPNEFVQLSYTNSTHHRLSSVSFADQKALDELYSKVQIAFARIDFGGEVSNGEVAQGEVNIVVPTSSSPSISGSSTESASPYMENCSVRSNWGLSGLRVDGSKVGGFKTAIENSVTVVSLQSDAEVFEVYYNGQWLSLKAAYAASQNIAEETVTNGDALDYLLSTVSLENMRYFYRSAFDIVGQDEKSSGLADDASDTRHFHTLVEEGATAQIQACGAVGPAIGFWTRSGGQAYMLTSNVTYGGQALRAEGFQGIGTAGGSIEPLRGFNVQGIRRPAKVNRTELIDEANHEYIFLNADPVSITTTQITFAEALTPESLFPYTLKGESAIWAKSLADGSMLKAILAEDPLSEDGLTLTVTSNQMVGFTPEQLSGIFIRRFKDPRSLTDRNYSLWVSNTSVNHRPPSYGDALRLAESPVASSQGLLAPGRQFDPGSNGGWNHVFTVSDVVTLEEGNSPNFAIAGRLGPSESSNNYYIALELGDAVSAYVGNAEGAGASQKLFANGSFTTQQDRAYQALYNQLDDAGTAPNSFDTVWKLSRTYALCQPELEAWIPDDYSAAADPNDSFYAEGMTYLRGVGPSKSAFNLTDFIDYDDGSATLGLHDNEGDGLYGDDVWFDPDFSHSKAAISRFIALLGYVPNEFPFGTFRQSQRNIPLSSFPPLSGNGYALATGAFPVEFNVPSAIVSGSFQWDFAGYFNYAKSLPKFQTDPLSTTQRFDSITSSAWGGKVVATGFTDRGEAVNANTFLVNERGESPKG